jgi:hypothetical protein
VSAIRRLAILAALVVLIGGSAAGRVLAVPSGSIGTWAASGSCGNGQMTIYPPEISSSPASVPGTIGGQHHQWVAWAVTVYYSSDLVTWTQTVAVPYWHVGQVGDDTAPTRNELWFDTMTQTWTYDMPVWNLNTTGYYAGIIQVYWYADAQAAAGTDSGQVPIYNQANIADLGPYPYCTVA